MEIIEIILQVWAMYHSNPLFWIIILIILTPFILWWWNFLKKQLDESGVIKSMANFRCYVANKLNHRMETRPTVIPSPKSGSPFNLWKELMIFLLMMSPLVIFLAISTTKPTFSLQWWSVVFWSTVILIFIFSMPIHISILTQWVSINKAVKKATKKLGELDTGDNKEKDNYLNIFLVIADDLRMGLDPRLLPMTIQPLKVDSLAFLNDLMSLRLVKPDRKTKPDTLAHRYYLTRIGATLIEKMEKKGKE